MFLTTRMSGRASTRKRLSRKRKKSWASICGRCPAIRVANQSPFLIFVAATAAFTASSSATPSAATTEGITAASTTATSLEGLASTTTASTLETALDILGRLLNGTLTTTPLLRNVEVALALATTPIEVALWSTFNSRAEVLALRHHLLSRRESHHTLLNRPFEITRHVIGKAATLDLTTRAITILNPWLSTRVSAAFNVGILVEVLIQAPTKLLVDIPIDLTSHTVTRANINTPLSIGLIVQINARQRTTTFTTAHLVVTVNASVAANLRIGINTNTAT